jgi:hypothetical protein
VTRAHLAAWVTRILFVGTRVHALGATEPMQVGVAEFSSVRRDPRAAEAAEGVSINEGFT